VALARNTEILGELLVPVTADYSEKVLPAVKELLDGTGVSPGEIGGIGISAGPGSYTGLRIGSSTAMGLSMGWGKPAKGVPTLRALALAAPDDRPVLVCLRARKGEVFASAYLGSQPFCEELFPAGVYTVEAVLRRLESMEDPVALGDGRSEMPSDVAGWLHPSMDSPRPSAVAVIAPALFESEGPDKHIEPLYLRRFGQKAGQVVP
jgi:tRNA threonylcarbamoyladenosine biosynthesis protein TsaB